MKKTSMTLKRRKNILTGYWSFDMIIHIRQKIVFASQFGKIFRWPRLNGSSL